MITFETERVRRIVGRLERGERVMPGFLAVAREHKVTSGWITGLGALEWVKLCEYDQVAREYLPARKFDVPSELLSLVGNFSFKDGKSFAHLHATISRETDNGVEVLGGHVVDAGVFALEFRVECYDDLILGRELDEATGLSLWTGESTAVLPPRAEHSPVSLVPEPKASPAAPVRGVSWAQVAEASVEPPQPVPIPRRLRAAPIAPHTPPAFAPQPLPDRARTTEDEFFEEPIPEKGDWIDHKVFGLCRVDGEDGSGNLVIKLPTGRRRAIKLDVLEVLAPRFDGDRRIYPVQPRRR